MQMLGNDRLHGRWIINTLKELYCLDVPTQMGPLILLTHLGVFAALKHLDVLKTSVWNTMHEWLHNDFCKVDGDDYGRAIKLLSSKHGDSTENDLLKLLRGYSPRGVGLEP